MAKKKFSPEYTAGDVLSLYQLRSQDGEEARLRDIATTIRSLTRLQHEVDIPGQYKAITKEVRTPFVRDAWLRISASLVTKTPLSHITPKDEKRAEYRDAANIAERFDAAMVAKLNRERGSDIDFQSASQVVRDGESVIKVAHRPDAWANFPLEDGDATSRLDRMDAYKRGAPLPIAWRDVDRLNFVGEGGEYGDEWVMEYGEYTKPYLKQRYGFVEGDRGDLINPENTLEGRPMPEGLHSSSSGRNVKLEFMTSKEWHVIVNGTEAPKFPKPNPYKPYIPYFRASAYDMESLLYSLIFLAPRLDELLTMKLNWSTLGAYPNPVLGTVPNAGQGIDLAIGDSGSSSGAGGQKPFTWKPGQLLDLPVGRTFGFVSPPPVGKDLNDLIVIFQQLIAIAGVPSIMRGISGAGDAGYLANQMMAAAQMLYKTAMLSLERQRSCAVDFSHWLIGNVVKQTVYVQGWSALNSKTGKPAKNAAQVYLGLSPDRGSKNVADISKIGFVDTKYRPTLPTDEQARAMIALQLTNAAKPLYDVRHALENLMEEEDPDAIIEALAVEQALQEEPLHSMVLDNAIAEAGIKPPAPPVPAALPATSPIGPAGPMAEQGLNNLGPVPLANEAPPGMSGVPGLTQPLVQRGKPPGSIRGGRRAGAYPGRPGGANRE